MINDVVDWHAHWVPPELVAYLSERTTEPMVTVEEDGRWFAAAPGLRQRLKENQLDIALRIAEMDRTGITRQVLSLAVVLGTFLGSLPAELEKTLVSANNGGLARLIRERGDRFSGLAALPLAHLAEAPAFLEKAVGEQGLLGAILPADAFADKATAERHAGIFEMANRLGAHLFIHPGPLPGTPPAPVALDDAEIVRRRAVAFQDSLTAAVVTFEYTDFLDPYPDAVVHVANLGGTIALLAERISMTAERMGVPPRLADGRLHRLIVDTASFGGRGVALAAETLGVDRLVFGSDSPALALAPARSGVEAAGLNAVDRKNILTGSALRRLGKKSSRSLTGSA
ncbi:amidohydrolase family protein [Telmatospirillum sp.]|uniref:amidohydrolase family protein n=1 Tax=Telmatospirillum sp. TaxID=2079197 RepID=UPI0028410A86|nr:amidohydrolase family protein [Telmatospirillum sp.]MDR3439486.1 amidohydrolase family protein [Telmatospirillum sp.]